jgi:hypothetical protein
MSAVVNLTSVLRTCAQCATEFPAPTVRRGKVQIYCGRPARPRQLTPDAPRPAQDASTA